MTRLALIILAGIFLLSSPVSGQMASDAEVRGSNVPLHAAPDPESEVRFVLQRHTPVRILGDAENATGEAKLVTVDTLGLSTDWFVPVEVLETAVTGWIPERYLTSRGIKTGVRIAPPIESIPSALSFSGTGTPNPDGPSLSTTVAASIGSLWLGLTPEEAAYIVDVSSIVSRNSQSVFRQVELLRTPRIGDSSWEDELQAEVDLWVALQGEALALQPPMSMSEIHDAYLSAASYQVSAGRAMLEATRSIDAETLEQARVLMQEFAPLVTAGVARLDEFLSDQGIAASP